MPITFHLDFNHLPLSRCGNNMTRARPIRCSFPTRSCELEDRSLRMVGVKSSFTKKKKKLFGADNLGSVSNSTQFPKGFPHHSGREGKCVSIQGKHMGYTLYGTTTTTTAKAEIFVLSNKLLK